MLSLNKSITNFKSEVEKLTSASTYLIRFQSFLNKVMNGEVDLSDQTPESIQTFIYNLPELYETSVGTYETKQQDGTVKIVPNIKHLNQLVKSGYKEEEITKRILEQKEIQRKPTDVKVGNNLSELIDCLKATYWNISSKDVCKLVSSMFEQIYNTQLAAGLTEGKDIQKILFIQSPMEGTGKSYATKSIVEDLNALNFKAGQGYYPDRKYPAAKEFGINHFTYIDETVSNQTGLTDQEQWMAIVRRSLINIKQKFEKPYSIKARGGIVCLGNADPVYGYGEIVSTIEMNLRQDEIQRESILGIVKENTCNTHRMFTCYKFTEEKVIELNKKLKEISEKLFFNRVNTDLSFQVVKLLRAAVNDGLWFEVFDGLFEKAELGIGVNLSSISVAQIFDILGISADQPRFTPLRNKLINFLRALKGESFIEKTNNTKTNAIYTKYDLTPLKEVNIEELTANDFDSPQDEVLETLRIYDLIKAELTGKDDDPTTDKPNNDETDTDTNSTTTTNEEGAGSAETNSKEISIKEIVGNDISPLTLDLLDLIEGPEVEIPDAPEEPTKYDTIEESNHSYERAEIIFASDQPEDQFEVLNPVTTYKRDDCVNSRRNFVFEMDNTPLEEQKKYLKDLIAKKIVNRWVFSGNKSIHMRITVNRDVNDTQEYKYIWKKLNAEYFDGKADRACANPARLTRRLNGIRVDYNEHNQKKVGKKQIGQNIGNFTIEILPIKEEYKGWKRNKEIVNELIHLMDNRRPRKYATLEETVEHWKDSDVKTAVLDCIAGNGNYYQGIQALSAAKFAGFTYDEVCKEIDFGSWNFREEFFNKIEF